MSQDDNNDCEEQTCCLECSSSHKSTHEQFNIIYTKAITCNLLAQKSLCSQQVNPPQKKLCQEQEEQMLRKRVIQKQNGCHSSDSHGNQHTHAHTQHLNICSLFEPSQAKLFIQSSKSGKLHVHSINCSFIFSVLIFCSLFMICKCEFFVYMSHWSKNKCTDLEYLLMCTYFSCVLQYCTELTYFFPVNFYLLLNLACKQLSVINNSNSHRKITQTQKRLDILSQNRKQLKLVYEKHFLG